MDVGDLDALQVVLAAIEVEKRGHRFYTQAAARTKDPRGKAMFQRLASDEVWHRRWLEEQEKALREKGQWQAVETQGAALSLGENIFPKTAGPRSGVRPRTRELEALRRGIQAEKDSRDFYREAAERTLDPSGRATFLLLVREEEKHLLLLEAEHDYLSQSGYFFDLPEFSIEALE
jgi:rubrerythrin